MLIQRERKLGIAFSALIGRRYSGHSISRNGSGTIIIFHSSPDITPVSVGWRKFGFDEGLLPATLSLSLLRVKLNDDLNSYEGNNVWLSISIVSLNIKTLPPIL
jgi:hypothetical protein